METGKSLTPVDRMKNIIAVPSVQEQFRNALQGSAPLFVASLIDVYGSDSYLQKCEPKAVIMEALKAATLKLPINKQLGFAYIVPYKGVPQFQVGYKGYIQLAIRTGQYRYINAGVIYQGETVSADRITGEISISGVKTSEETTGYFAHLETVNGFRKTLFWTKEQVLAHAQKFSKIFNSPNSVWRTNFDAMAIKTVLRNLLSKYALMSVEMVQAFTSDSEDYEAKIQAEIDDNANREAIDVSSEVPAKNSANEEVAEEASSTGPDF